ncbi:hypothetical protein E2C01_083499 [Portunus trituberculatus]|uniref:Uncharacterized protein n=1 Tax=Portunus trituberculatus TaxID=210409 RepID=A0A5B7J1E1_PORTR|nr:hypothetical protein [Portunus trituberculatus]
MWARALFFPAPQL